MSGIDLSLLGQIPSERFWNVNAIDIHLEEQISYLSYFDKPQQLAYEELYEGTSENEKCQRISIMQL